ncbi:hypothetical protein GMMP15_1660003 [Candidatus Magnetomoraceae bacterium gMMP-15]
MVLIHLSVTFVSVILYKYLILYNKILFYIVRVQNIELLLID